MKKVILLNIWIISLLMAGVAVAMDERGYQYEISPVIGGYHFDNEEDLDIGVSAGAILGIPVEPWATLELSGSAIRTKTKAGSDDVDIHRLGLGGLFYLSDAKAFRPFVGFGVGVLKESPRVGEDATDYLVNFGVGFKYRLTDRLDLRVDVNHDIPFREDKGNVAWTLGLTWRLGKASLAPVSYEAPIETMVEKPMAMEKMVVVETMVSDADGDGVIDEMDHCSKTPKGAPVDMQGCWTVPMVLFDFGKAEIIKAHEPGLDGLVKVLKANPEFSLLIEGHTDNIGPETYNEALSKARAEAVMVYIMEKGIEADRIKVMWVGEVFPLADNATLEGRQKNRRVDFMLKK